MSAVTTRKTGRVKFFNSQKGFGFIIDSESTEASPTKEVFVHHTAIHNNGGFKSLAEGEIVEYDVVPGPKGMQAANVTGPNGAPVQGDPNAGRQVFGGPRFGRNEGYGGFGGPSAYGGGFGQQGYGQGFNQQRGFGGGAGFVQGNGQFPYGGYPLPLHQQHLNQPPHLNQHLHQYSHPHPSQPPQGFASFPGPPTSTGQPGYLGGPPGFGSDAPAKSS
ncbi:hypothetical protein EMPS_00587 [Entomortierella parvispora]|uniref:CSD domain-containing protein n=1 Tax=Entomortierella parvispora TaxID=205924 RepID=A0A9P3H177_9FUNG|nr:hypothetical protein EMPS_00587 [Entomortierella parvispora]